MSYNANTGTVYTAHDLVWHLLSSLGGGSQDGENSPLRMAVVHGVREVMNARDWLWHTKTNTFTTNAATTPPVTLLPKNVKSLETLISDSTGATLAYITPNEYLQLRANQSGTAEPFYYTILRSETYPDYYEIKFVYDPIDNLEYHYTYRYRPQEIKYMGYEPITRGEVEGITPGAGYIDLPDRFKIRPDFVGRIIRLGDYIDSIGYDPQPIGGLYPYAEQHRIASWSNVNNVRYALDTTVGVQNKAERKLKFVITDELDASPQMWTTVLSACEMWYARMAGKPASEVTALFNRDMRIAMESDAISPSGTTVRSASPRTMGWHSNLLPDVT